MIIKTIGKMGNEFKTVAQFNREYKELKDNFCKQVNIGRNINAQQIMMLWGRFHNEERFVRLTNNTKVDMTDFIKAYKDDTEFVFKLELLSATMKYQGERN